MEQDIEMALYSGQISMDKSSNGHDEDMLCDICNKKYSLSDMACDNICMNCIDSIIPSCFYSKESKRREMGYIA